MAAFGLVGVVTAIGGMVLAYRARVGPTSQVEIDACHPNHNSRSDETCTGTWVTGGALVGGDGHVVIGEIVGAEREDVGRTLEVRIHGETAYTDSVRVAVLLMAFGVFIAAMLLYLAWQILRSS